MTAQILLLLSNSSKANNNCATAANKQDMDLFKIAVVFAVFGRSHNNKENKIKSRIKGVVGKRVRVDRTTRTGSIGLWIYTLFYNS